MLCMSLSKIQAALYRRVSLTCLGKYKFHAALTIPKQVCSPSPPMFTFNVCVVPNTVVEILTFEVMYWGIWKFSFPLNCNYYYYYYYYHNLLLYTNTNIIIYYIIITVNLLNYFKFLIIYRKVWSNAYFIHPKVYILMDKYLEVTRRGRWKWLRTQLFWALCG